LRTARISSSEVVIGYRPTEGEHIVVRVAPPATLITTALPDGSEDRRLPNKCRIRNGRASLGTAAAKLSMPVAEEMVRVTNTMGKYRERWGDILSSAQLLYSAC
jgi:hypothetical protein